MDRFSALGVLFLVAASASACASLDTSPIKADLDGDGIPEIVALGQDSKTVTVSVQLGSGKSSHPQELSFGINSAQQDAICSLPAKLAVTPLSCVEMGAPIPGCEVKSGSKALVLSGGDCDPINLYWNHQTGRLAWWRH